MWFKCHQVTSKEKSLRKSRANCVVSFKVNVNLRVQIQKESVRQNQIRAFVLLFFFFVCLNWLCYSVVGFLCVFLCRNDQSDKSAEPIEIIQEKKKRKSAVWLGSDRRLFLSSLGSRPPPFRTLPNRKQKNQSRNRKKKYPHSQSR